jgi:hypothetical protein
MPRYYFHLSNKRCVTDPYGTMLIDKDAAMTHAGRHFHVVPMTTPQHA